jgi:hypothetical protein
MDSMRPSGDDFDAKNFREGGTRKVSPRNPLALKRARPRP